MKKNCKRVLWSLWACFVFLNILSLYLIWFQPKRTYPPSRALRSDRFSEVAFGKIQEGMSQSKVIEVLGRPLLIKKLLDWPVREKNGLEGLKEAGCDMYIYSIYGIPPGLDQWILVFDEHKRVIRKIAGFH